MVATLQKLDHILASITTLPALIFRLSDNLCCVRVVGTISTTVVLRIALDTNLGIAFRTFPVILPVVVLAYVLGPNKFAAVLSRAVDAVAVGVFAILLVPSLFKVVTKEALYMFKGNLVFSAAFGWHVLGIGDRQLEASLEARFAHAVAALELNSLSRFQIVHTDETLDSEILD